MSEECCNKKRHTPENVPVVGSPDRVGQRNPLTLSILLLGFTGVVETINQVLLVAGSGEVPASSLAHEVSLAPGAIIDL